MRSALTRLLGRLTRNTNLELHIEATRIRDTYLEEQAGRTGYTAD
jgi:hypothetical protein